MIPFYIDKVLWLFILNLSGFMMILKMQWQKYIQFLQHWAICCCDSFLRHYLRETIHKVLELYSPLISAVMQQHTENPILMLKCASLLHWLPSVAHMP